MTMSAHCPRHRDKCYFPYLCSVALYFVNTLANAALPNHRSGPRCSICENRHAHGLYPTIVFTDRGPNSRMRSVGLIELRQTLWTILSTLSTLTGVRSVGRGRHFRGSRESETSGTRGLSFQFISRYFGLHIPPKNPSLWHLPWESASCLAVLATTWLEPFSRERI